VHEIIKTVSLKYSTQVFVLAAGGVFRIWYVVYFTLYGSCSCSQAQALAEQLEQKYSEYLDLRSFVEKRLAVIPR
jgi:hypothetical protein